MSRMLLNPFWQQAEEKYRDYLMGRGRVAETELIPSLSWVGLGVRLQ
jgi:hypothetical protein